MHCSTVQCSSLPGREYLRAREGACHGGAEEDIDTEHDEEEDSEDDTEPEEPGGAQLAVSSGSWGRGAWQSWGVGVMATWEL